MDHYTSHVDVNMDIMRRKSRKGFLAIFGSLDSNDVSMRMRNTYTSMALALKYRTWQ
jgi:hypothetical protein